VSWFQHSTLQCRRIRPLTTAGILFSTLQQLESPTLAYWPLAIGHSLAPDQNLWVWESFATWVGTVVAWAFLYHYGWFTGCMIDHCLPGVLQRMFYITHTVFDPKLTQKLEFSGHRSQVRSQVSGPPDLAPWPDLRFSGTPDLPVTWDLQVWVTV
jgi:hypothetical protein